MSKIILIGANHAGTAAINTILDQYPDHEVVVYDANDNISYLACGTALWIGDQITDPAELFYSSKEKMESRGATVYMETRVTRIDFANKTIHAQNKDGKEWIDTYDKLILATGSLPISPNLPGKELENVQFVKFYQDGACAIDALKDDRIQDVGIVGAGYIGVELAEAIVRNGRRAHLFDVADSCLSTYYDPEFRGEMDTVLKKHGVQTHYGQAVTELRGDEQGRVNEIVTDQGAFSVQLAMLAIGFRPNTELGKDDIALFRNGAYQVNRKQETSIPDVYAIGDCATLYDNARQSDNYIALATNAVRSGIVAAHNACGTPLESIGVQGSNGICIFGYKMVSTGMSVQMAKAAGFDVEYTDFEDLQKPGFIKSENHPVKIRIVYEKTSRRIVGAQMASYEDMSMGIHMFSLAIEEKVTIDKLKLLDIFFLPHFNQPYNYITMAALQAK